MLFDVLICLLIVAVAILLGVTVHPLLLLLILLVGVFLLTRHGTRV